MARTVTGRELADNQRTALYHRLLQLKKNGHVGFGDMKEIMRTFNVSQQTISRIWLGGARLLLTQDAPGLRQERKAAVVRLASQVLDKTFMTLQKVMEEAFKLEGDNVYKLSHLKKDVQLKSETVALRPPCDEDVTLALETLETRIVAVMRANPQDDPTQVVCVHELLYVLRHDPSDFTLHKLMTHDIIPFLLKLVREFRFHAVLLTDIMHVMMLLAKLAVEHAEVLVRESAGALIAKTMVLHPTEDRLQQYTTSLLQTLRTTAVPTGRVAGKPAGFEIAFFNNEYAASNRPATTTLWTPVTGEGSCHKHRASPLEPFQLVSAKSQALAERSRTPELSHSKLRRVLSSPKVPTLTAHNTTLLTNTSSGTQQHTMENEENELVAATPLLLRPESCPTFDQLTIDLATTGATPKPWSSQSSLRRKPATSVKRLAPMLVTTPTLGAYRSSPLFVEPLDTAKRVDALHGRMMSTRGPCRPSVSFASVVVNVGATYLSQGEYLKALEAFEIAQKMHPHHPKAMYNAGLAHWHLGHSQLTATKVLTKHQTMCDFVDQST
ncbi:hypothetical protein DYB37_010230 [Aphanomyces astaci]|uniref:DUF7769 domain-containing protein n=1 Tax=Aphanomyces astaci TaxID=112090 RepID=A0A3R6ZXE7_APHAT|nr:hypothetical protein DYB37_010230 [Aphanomyces astaci]